MQIRCTESTQKNDSTLKATHFSRVPLCDEPVLHDKHLYIEGPHEIEAERVMKARILRRSNERGSERSLGVGFASERPVKIGQVDRCRRKLRAQSQCSLVFGLGVGGTTTLSKEASERRARFRPIGIEALRVDELCRRALKSFAVGGRLV
jgi:hypothetical protein